jgi:hypothetical protein
MSKLHQLDAEKIVPMSRLRQLRAENIVLLPLIAGVIAGIICLVGARSTISPREEPPAAAAGDHAASPVSEYHPSLRGPG